MIQAMVTVCSGRSGRRSAGRDMEDMRLVHSEEQSTKITKCLISCKFSMLISSSYVMSCFNSVDAFS